MGYWEDRAKQEQERAKTLQEQAKRRIPEQYHDFLQLLRQPVKLGKPKNFTLSETHWSMGMYLGGKENSELYVPVYLPYFTVDGRVVWAREEHRETKKRLVIHPAEFDFTNKICRVNVESELLGSASGTAKIGSGGGVDSTNPVENAETSAIGRALGFLGYGLVGTGIASAEEVTGANKEKEKSNTSPSQEPANQEPANQEPTKPRSTQKSAPRWVRGVLKEVNVGELKYTQKGQSVIEHCFIVTFTNGYAFYVPTNSEFAKKLDEFSPGQTLEAFTRPWAGVECIAGNTGKEIREVKLEAAGQ